MKDSIEVCGGKPECPSNAKFACSCRNPVVFLCESCAVSHLYEPHRHLFLPLGQARQFLNPSEFPGKVYSKHIEIKKSFEDYIQKIKDFRARVCILKQEILQDIEMDFQTNIEKIDRLLDISCAKFRKLNVRTAEFTKVDQDIVRKYESKGLRGFIENYVESLKANEHNIKQVMQGLITIETSALPREEENEHSVPISQDSKKVPETKLEVVKELLVSQVERIAKSIEEVNHKTIPKVQELIKCLNELKPSSINQPQEPSKDSLYNSELNASYQLISPNAYSAQSIKLPTTPRTPRTPQTPQTSLTHLNFDLAPYPEEIKSFPTLPTGGVSIFAAICGTKRLVKYDPESDVTTTYQLEHVVTNYFNRSSSCILPDSSILIVGGYTSYPNMHGDTYKVDVSKEPPRCIKLSDLHYPRIQSKMICHFNTVYILGGEYSKKAELMRLTETAWTQLPDMKEARKDFGVYASGERIYLIGGWNNTSIEYYDIRLQTFILLSDVQVPKGGMICGVIDDRIYAVGKDHLRVFSMDFLLLDSQNNVHNKEHSCYSDVIVKDSNLIYIDSSSNKVYSFDARSKTTREIRRI